jgi:hypothetical protein
MHTDEATRHRADPMPEVPLAEPPRRLGEGLMPKIPSCESCGGALDREAPIGCLNRLHRVPSPTLAERMAWSIMEDVASRAFLAGGWGAMTQAERSEALECWVEIVRVALNS